MRQIDKRTIARWKDPKTVMPKIDYGLNTCYYRVVEPATLFADAHVLAASVEPLRAIKSMTPTSELWEISL